MSLQELLLHLQTKQKVFKDVLAFIQQHYNYHPTSFRNGEIVNAANENQGSARILYFAKLNNLSEEDTLSLFAEHYEEVKFTPEGDSHPNIRQFIRYGWNGVAFEQPVLSKK